MEKSKEEEEEEAGMLSRDQLIYFFDRFHILTSQPEVKHRIGEAVHDKQEEAVAITTCIQQDIFTEMGVDPHFGLSCLPKLNLVFHNDLDFMIRFYAFVTKEELVCEEAELGPLNFQLKMEMQLYLQEQQLEMLNHMRNFNLDQQSAIIQKIRQQMEIANFDPEASLLSIDQINDIVG